MEGAGSRSCKSRKRLARIQSHAGGSHNRPSFVGTERAGNCDASFVVADRNSINIRQSFQRYALSQRVMLNYCGGCEEISLDRNNGELLHTFFRWVSHSVVYNRAGAKISVSAEFRNPDMRGKERFPAPSVSAPVMLIVQSVGIGISPENLANLCYHFCRSEGKRINRAKLRTDLLFSKVVLDLKGGIVTIESRNVISDAKVFTQFVFMPAGEGIARDNDFSSFASAMFDHNNDILIENIGSEEGCAAPVKNPQHHNSEVNNSDNKFLHKLMGLLESHISDPDFNVGKLVSEIGMSRPVLFRKAKILTGSSIINLIRSKRLKMAEMLLKQKKVAVSEVAFKVGYTDPKYFSKSFRSEFGKTPKEYVHGLSLQPPGGASLTAVHK